MNLMFWNCRRLWQTSTVRTLRDFYKSHKSMIVFISKVKLYCYVRVSKIIFVLGYDDFYLIPSVGSAGGLLLMWNHNLSINIISFLYIYFCSNYP